MAQKKKKYNTTANPLEIPGNLLKFFSWVYLFLIFAYLPLYTQNKYQNLGAAKFNFYLYSTVSFLILMTILSIFWLIIHLYDIRWKNLLSSITIMDKFAFAYMAVLLLSYLLSDYKSMALWGYPGWSMGLIPQLLIILVYFFISRCLEWHRMILWVALIPSAIVFILGILHRFQIDPLQFYTGLNSTQRLQFLSTVGQATWYSSYLCVIFPVGMFLFWQENQTARHRLLGAYCAIGFASLVTQNSDSAFIGIGLVFLLLFCNSFQSNLQFRRFLELLLLCLGSMRMIGILQLLFPHRVPELEGLSIFLSQHPSLWVLFAALALLYWYFCRSDVQRKISISHYKWVRIVCLLLFLLSIAVMILLIILTTTGQLPEALRFLEGTQYFQFNERWGNHRGFTWHHAWTMFWDYPFNLKLFGCGPDSFAGYSYAFYKEFLDSYFGGLQIANAHNEYLNILLTTGIFGFISYLGFFIGGFIHFIKNSPKNPLILLISGCILSYIGHNIFCYQQIMCTPYLFIIIAVGISYENKL